MPREVAVAAGVVVVGEAEQAAEPARPAAVLVEAEQAVELRVRAAQAARRQAQARVRPETQEAPPPA